MGYSWGRERTDGTLNGTQNVSVFRTAGPALGSSVTTAPLGLIGRANMDGVIGGGQIGYNWQASKWLFGLEADFQGSDERATADVCTVAGCPLGSSILAANYKSTGSARYAAGLASLRQIECCFTPRGVSLMVILQRAPRWCPLAGDRRGPAGPLARERKPRLTATGRLKSNTCTWILETSVAVAHPPQPSPTL